MDKNKLYDFIIVGQGIAGTLLAHFLLESGKSVCIIDNNHKGAASKVAAGIVNPITGKNFVRSWRVNEFLPIAKKVYGEIAQKLNITTYTEVNIIRTLENTEAENNWLARTADESVSEYMLANSDVSSFEGKVAPAFGYGELTGTFQVHLSDILDAYKLEFIKNDQFLEDAFDHSGLIIMDDYFEYKYIQGKEIVFCEGYKGQYNPFFTKMGFGPSKGEVLHVKIPNADFTKLYKDKIFIVQLYDDVYWVGSGYEWNAPDDLPSDAARTKLTAELDRLLLIPYEILDHKAAIRPTMHNRRPLLAMHPTIPGMYMFNGLGTKGSSIGPFVAKQFAKYLVTKYSELLEL
ncbi:MAG TPA: FAD-binding oxidoreductase [Saprospiraceae bacterium]|nr:FAD-binding oxidoreductase [Saprospiraceae bacterium]